MFAFPLYRRWTSGPAVAPPIATGPAGGAQLWRPAYHYPLPVNDEPEREPIALTYHSAGALYPRGAAVVTFAHFDEWELVDYQNIERIERAFGVRLRMPAPPALDDPQRGQLYWGRSQALARLAQQLAETKRTRQIIQVSAAVARRVAMMATQQGRDALDLAAIEDALRKRGDDD